MTKSISQRVDKVKARLKDKKTRKVKTAVSITDESFRRLGAFVLSENMTQSEAIELLIEMNLSGYVLQVRGGGLCDVADRQSSISPAVIDDRLDSADNVNALAANAA